MNKRFLIQAMVFLAAVLLSPFGASAMMDILDGKAGVDSSAEFGYEYRQVDGDRPSYFEAYRDVPKGFLFDSFHLYGTWNDPNLPAYLRLDGRDIDQDDKELCAEGGVYGLLRVRFKYMEQPRLFSTGNKFLESYSGNGRYRIDPSIQADLTDVNNDGVIPPADTADVPIPTTFADFTPLRLKLADHIANANSVDLGFQRETSDAEAFLAIAPGLGIRLGYNHQHKDGTKITSNGVYDRRRAIIADALINDFEQLRVVVLDLPEPIDWDSDIVNAGIELSRGHTLLALKYTFQNFRNGVNALRWDNPFRSAPDLDVNTDPAIPAGDRDRYRGIATSTGLQVLPPDSYSHTGTLTAGVDLPMDTRLNATLSAGGTWQDDQFFPFSANTVMETNVPDGLGGFINANDPRALPKRSLDGVVLNIVQDYRLTARPVDPLTVTAKYRYYYYDNKTDKIELPGFARRSDSIWSAEEVSTKTPSYLRQNASLEAGLDLFNALSASADGGWERWRRWERNVERTDEYKVGGGIVVRPISWAKVMADYHWSHRVGSQYFPNATLNPPDLESPLARMWDQSNRVRHEAKARLAVTPLESLDFCVNGSYASDSYNPAQLGLKSDYGWTAGAEATYSVGKDITFTATYSHEDFRHRLFAGSKTSVLGDTPLSNQFTEANRWNSKLMDRTDNFSIGLGGGILPGRLDFGTYYNLTMGVGRIYTYNPNALVAGDTINSAIAYPYDRNKVVDHEVRAELTYHFLKHFALNLRYIYENFQIDDFAWKDLGNQIPSVTQTLNGTTQVVNETSRVAFLNSQYSDYDAHVGIVTLSYNF